MSLVRLSSSVSPAYRRAFLERAYSGADDQASKRLAFSFLVHAFIDGRLRELFGRGVSSRRVQRGSRPQWGILLCSWGLIQHNLHIHLRPRWTKQDCISNVRVDWWFLTGTYYQHGAFLVLPTHS